LVKVLAIVKARDSDGLFQAGSDIDRTCEACHLEYWYPGDKQAVLRDRDSRAYASEKKLGAYARRNPTMKATLAVSTFVPAVVLLCGTHHVHAAAPATGTIVGHVRLTGPSPGNPMIRMGMDPVCAQLNTGTRPVQAIVVRAADGGLANVLVDLEGTFPSSGPPAEVLTVDQQKCVYTPRVIGAHVGQTLRIKNDDAVLHNVHGVSMAGNDFNFSQPTAGMTRDIVLKGPDIVLRLKCDIHSWMIAYIAVESHPYFSVSAADGSFTIGNVSAGRFTIRAWHERYGELRQTVNVMAGKSVTADFVYSGKEQANHARVQDVILHG
jgi:plastocyanin